MTTERRDQHSTEFGLWLRKQREIDSGLGFIATNLDYIWKNYKTGDWMLIEEKRHKAQPQRWQHDIFQLIHSACRHDANYRGMHLITFENTSPDDGLIWLDKKQVTKDQLIKFLQFKK